MITSARLFAILLIAVAVAACGGGDDSKSAGEPNAATETQSEAKDANDSTGDCDGEPIKNEEVDGIQLTRHCGPASATVEFGGKTTTFDSGSCQPTDEAVTINLGTSVTDLDATQEQRDAIDYFGLNVGRFPQIDPDATPAPKDGTYTEGILISGTGPDTTFPVVTETTVTLMDGRTKGTFEGTTEAGPISGTFDCGE